MKIVIIDGINQENLNHVYKYFQQVIRSIFLHLEMLCESIRIIL